MSPLLKEVDHLRVPAMLTFRNIISDKSAPSRSREPSYQGLEDFIEWCRTSVASLIGTGL
jgi:hypothetical protein